MAVNPKDIPINQAVSITLDGKKISGFENETIFNIAKREGLWIPHLCYKEGMRPDGNCRVCMVEIEGERTLQPSCVRTISEGMIINTTSDRVKHSQKLVLELLDSDISEIVYNKNSELNLWKNLLQVGKSRFPSKIQDKHDVSHPAIAVNLDACIQCTRCVRACREEQVNDVIGYAKRGNDRY